MSKIWSTTGISNWKLRTQESNCFVVRDTPSIKKYIRVVSHPTPHCSAFIHIRVNVSNPKFSDMKQRQHTRTENAEWVSHLHAPWYLSLSHSSYHYLLRFVHSLTSLSLSWGRGNNARYLERRRLLATRLYQDLSTWKEPLVSSRRWVIQTGTYSWQRYCVYSTG